MTYFCCNGVDDKWVEKFIEPEPISEEYKFSCVVEDYEYLRYTYRFFEKSNNGFEREFVDVSRKRKYIQETNTAVFEGVGNQRDLFIWVLPNLERALPLGYIHEGYCFVRES